MSQNGEDGEMREALIRLESAGIEGVESIVRKIEDAGGRTLMSYPPSVIVAFLPEQAIGALRDDPGIRQIDTGEIPEDTLDATPDAIRFAIVAWNEHLKVKAAPREQPLRGLLWDAPGLLPPDPPREIQERLRRREQEIHT